MNPGWDEINHLNPTHLLLLSSHIQHTTVNYDLVDLMYHQLFFIVTTFSVLSKMQSFMIQALERTIFKDSTAENGNKVPTIQIFIKLEVRKYIY